MKVYNPLAREGEETAANYLKNKDIKLSTEIFGPGARSLT